jgi:ATP-dependent Clp protease protease subunit
VKGASANHLREPPSFSPSRITQGLTPSQRFATLLDCIRHVPGALLLRCCARPPTVRPVIVKSGPAPQRFQPPDKERSQPWEIVISGDLTEQGNELLAKLVEVPFGSTGLIFFDSGGGSAYAGLALAAVIRLRGLQATGVVAGECSSAAIIPFAACTQRVVTAQATLLFHPVRWQSDEDMQLEQAAEWARHFQVLEHSMDELLSKFFGISVSRITSWTRPGRFLTGTEFAAEGLATLVDLFSGDLRQQLRTK